MMDLFNSVGQAIISLLPLSPFVQFYSAWTAPEWVSWFNWLFPVQEILYVMAAWCTAIAVYYVYSVIARWLGVIM